MTSSYAATGEGDACVTAYEVLRERVVGGASGGGHSGLVVILREGIAAWIAHGPAASASVRPPVVPTSWVAASTLSHEVHADVVSVLAGMALSIRREKSR